MVGITRSKVIWIFTAFRSKVSLTSVGLCTVVSGYISPISLGCFCLMVSMPSLVFPSCSLACQWNESHSRDMRSNINQGMTQCLFFSLGYHRFVAETLLGHHVLRLHSAAGSLPRCKKSFGQKMSTASDLLTSRMLDHFSPSHLMFHLIVEYPPIVDHFPCASVPPETPSWRSWLGWHWDQTSLSGSEDLRRFAETWRGGPPVLRDRVRILRDDVQCFSGPWICWYVPKVFEISPYRKSDFFMTLGVKKET